MEMARRENLTNSLFLRFDFFRLPFQASLPLLLCADTLLNGPANRVALLKSIGAATAPSGYALVDFHNRWHNPLRRLGFLPQNFDDNRSYTRQ